MSALSSSLQKRLMQQARVMHGHAMTRNRQPGRDALGETLNSGVGRGGKRLHLGPTHDLKTCKAPPHMHPLKLLSCSGFFCLLAAERSLLPSGSLQSLHVTEGSGAHAMPQPAPLSLCGSFCSYWKLNGLFGLVARGAHRCRLRIKATPPTCAAWDDAPGGVCTPQFALPDHPTSTHTHTPITVWSAPHKEATPTLAGQEMKSNY